MVSDFELAYLDARSRYTAEEWEALPDARKTAAIYSELRLIDKGRQSASQTGRNGHDEAPGGTRTAPGNAAQGVRVIRKI